MSVHPLIPTNELRLVMSYTKMKASARRQYTAVIGPNRSCPAVSHSCSNTGSLSTVIVCVMQSIPRVMITCVMTFGMSVCTGVYV